MAGRRNSRQRHCARTRRCGLLLLASLLIAACTANEPPPRQDPVVVYAAFEDDAAVVETFERYTDETGVLVIVRRGPADRIVNDLIENRVSPPADLLLTRSAVDAWRAAEDSALRPMFSEVLAEQVPAWARDPDDLWFGTAARVAVIARSQRSPLPDIGPDLASLADPAYAGTLCLTTSRKAGNRAIVAGLIGELGVREAELVVRGWIANLAAPPFEDNARLLDALAGGRCQYGIVVDAAPELEPHTAGALATAAWPVDIEAVGVARHAQNPEGAVALAKWLIAEGGSATGLPAYPDAGADMVAMALHYDEAARLAERARYP